MSLLDDDERLILYVSLGILGALLLGIVVLIVMDGWLFAPEHDEDDDGEQTVLKSWQWKPITIQQQQQQQHLQQQQRSLATTNIQQERLQERGLLQSQQQQPIHERGGLQLQPQQPQQPMMMIHQPQSLPPPPQQQQPRQMPRSPATTTSSNHYHDQQKQQPRSNSYNNHNDYSKLYQGIQVLKIEKNGKAAKHYLTISNDMMGIYCTRESITEFMDKSAGEQQPSFGFSSQKLDTLRKRVKGVGGHKNADQTHIDVADLVDITEGVVCSLKLEQYRTESRLKGILSDVDIHRQQIVCMTHHGNTTLNMLVKEKDRKLLLDCLKQMMKEYEQTKQHISNEGLLLRYIWYDLDSNRDDQISEKEFINILHRINVDLKNPRKFFRQFLQDQHIKRNELNFNEIMLLIQKVKAKLASGTTMTDKVWNQHFGAEKTIITAEEFLYNFLHKIQWETEMTLPDAKSLIDKIHNDAESTLKKDQNNFPRHHLSRYHFDLYLNSVTNEAFDPASRATDPRPLDKPMSHYWINTSHNTYLIGDQLQSSSSVEMYMRALRRGCKCLELDCWDGEDPEDTTNNEAIPIVFHGHTLTSKIAFIEILHGVKAYLDKHPDTYPIILSLENHCSHPFQSAMAKNMKDVFGDKLYIPPKEVGEMVYLPSPESLRGMIVIKGKRPPAPDDAPPEAEDDSDPYAAEGGEDAPDASRLDNTGAGTEPVKPPKIVPELAEMTLFHGTKYKSFEESILLPPSHMHSIGETKIPKLVDNDVKNAKLWQEYNQKHMTRTYPAGVRVDSSNYNPMLAWSVGSQLVALNFQTPDDNLIMNDGRFRVKGGCGYVLKPHSVMGIGASGASRPIELQIRIIGGSCLPKPFGYTYGEVIDPYVNVSLHDVQEDGGNYEATVDSQQTEFVDNNGFCPMFGETFSFKVNNPDCAIIVFDVQEKDTVSDDKVAHSAIPFSCLRRGVRSIQLYDNHNTCSGAFGFASLLVEINF